MPNGLAPDGIAVGDDASSVRLPPSTANAPIASPSSTRNSVEPSGDSRASNAPAPVNEVLPSSVSVPSGRDRVAGDAAGTGVDGEQELPVVADLDPARRRLASANGEPPIARQRPVGCLVECGDASRCRRRRGRSRRRAASGSSGWNSLPNGPTRLAAKGEPGAGSEPTVGTDGEAVDERRVHAGRRRGGCHRR